MNLNQWVQERPNITVEEIKQQHEEVKFKISSIIWGIVWGVILMGVTTNIFHPTYNIWGLIVWLGEHFQ